MRNRFVVVLLSMMRKGGEKGEKRKRKVEIDEKIILFTIMRNGETKKKEMKGKEKL